MQVKIAPKFQIQTSKPNKNIVLYLWPKRSGPRTIGDTLTSNWHRFFEILIFLISHFICHDLCDCPRSRPLRAQGINSNFQGTNWHKQSTIFLIGLEVYIWNLGAILTYTLSNDTLRSKNGSFDLKDIMISFVARSVLKIPPEGKSLEIDTVSQNRLNTVKNHEI